MGRAARLSALSRFPVLYVGTHDSIDLGEDGPTHQPVEVMHLMRSTPNFLCIRPADGNEVAGAYACYLREFEKHEKLSARHKKPSKKRSRDDDESPDWCEGDD